jgi:hypothetical protein
MRLHTVDGSTLSIRETRIFRKASLKAGLASPALRGMQTLLLWTAVQGCSAGQTVIPVTQSEAVPPGAVIVPRGEAVGKSSCYDFTLSGIPSHLYPDVMNKAIQAAIESQQADLLVDATLSMRVTQFPIINLPVIWSANVWWIQWTAEGTAAKIKVPASEAARLDDRTETN